MTAHRTSRQSTDTRVSPKHTHPARRHTPPPHTNAWHRHSSWTIKDWNSTCPLAWDKWIFRRTTKIANIVVRQTTWIAAGSVTRHILVSDFNGIPLIQSRQAWQFLLWSPLKQLLSSVHYTMRRRFRNAGLPPLSSVLGGVTAESPTAIALIGCWAPAVIGFPAHPGSLLQLSVSAAFAFSSCK